MKLNWTAIGVLGGLLLYAGSVEYRLGTYQSTLDVSERVQNLETLLQPVLIEYRVEQRLKELRGEVSIMVDDAPEPPMMVPHLAPPEEELREEAQEWAAEQFKR